MVNVRNVLRVLMASVLAGMVVSCGGGAAPDTSGETTTPTVGGNITRITAPVTLRLNGGSDMRIAGPGPFTFPTALASGNTFNVQLVAPNQKCSIARGAGTAGNRNITNVEVDCVAPTDEIIVQTTRLAGAQEVPAVAATGTGVGGVIADPADRSITGGITFRDLTGAPSDVSIYTAAPGANGASFITLALAADNATATIPAGTFLSTQQFADLLAGNLYFNVKTAANPAGEIRGQINVQGGVFAGLRVMNAAQEVPPSSSAATGVGTLLVDAATHVVLISYMTYNVASPTFADIHTSASGVRSAGPPIINFNLGTGIACAPAGAQMTAENMLDFGVNDLLYFNVRSQANPDGDIRGDISRFQ
jgi:hypothetical protein